MELNDLRSAWADVQVTDKTSGDIRLMLKENRHPVLKGIRKQLTIEIAGWSAFLLCYYSMFDGDKKSPLLNILLVVSVSLALIHNLLGYNIAKYLVNGVSLKESLNKYFEKVKIYARISIAARLLFITGFVLFFTYDINFDTRKYLLLALLIVLSLSQLLFLGRIWAKRLKDLQAAVVHFD